jgi:hypothetical protein
MTQNNALPADGPSLAAPADDRRKKLLVLGGVGGAVIVAAVLFLLFSGGGSSTSGANAPLVRGSARATAPGSPVASTSTVVVPAAYNGPAGRNPFSPLVTAPGGGAGGTGSSSPSASVVVPAGTVTPTPTPTPTPTFVFPTGVPFPSATSTPTATVTVTATPSPSKSASPTPSPSASVTPTPTPTPSGPETLILTAVDTAGGDVTVTVNGTTYTPTTGTVFAQYFKLVSILSGTDPSTGQPTSGADFEYGDQFVQLAVGQSATFSG